MLLKRISLILSFKLIFLTFTMVSFMSFTVSAKGGVGKQTNLTSNNINNTFCVDDNCFFPDKQLDDEDIHVVGLVDWDSDKNLVLNTRGNIVFEQGAKIVSKKNGSIILKSGMEPGKKKYTGTVLFNDNNHQIELNGNGVVKIYYNPVKGIEKHKYHNPTIFDSHVYPRQKVIQYMLVNDIYDLQAISALLYGSYALSRNIDATPTKNWKDSDGYLRGFYPIMGVSDKAPFSGVFDGQGYTINGLFINRPDEANVGLFGDVTGINEYKSAIKNFVLMNGNIVGKRCVGGAVGQATGVVLENINIPKKYNSILSVLENEHIEDDISGYIAGCVFYNTHANLTKEEDGKIIDNDKSLFGSCVSCNDDDSDNKEEY